MAKARGRREAKKQEKQEGQEKKLEKEFKSALESPEDDLKNHHQEEISDVHLVPQLVKEALPTTFFGLLDKPEKQFFLEAESTLNINVFDNDEEKQKYINSIFNEVKGKELKLVTDQICSKLMERLILEANDSQLKNIFQSFEGFFVKIAHHKYSSHCLETLLVRCAALIEKELLNPNILLQESIDSNEEYSPMDSMFIFMINEYIPYLQEMLENQYASHTLRLILLILASKELPSTTVSNSTLRSKKSKVARKMIEIKDNEDFSKNYQVPSTFKFELKKTILNLTQGLSITKLRQLSIDKVSSPVIQIIIKVESIYDKNKTIYNTIFNADEKESAYMEYCLTDPVGSHFLQFVIMNTKSKLSERLFETYMKDRLMKLVNRNTTAVYVIQSLLQKLKTTYVKQILDILMPNFNQITDLNLELSQDILDKVMERKAYKKDLIIQQVLSKYSSSSLSNKFIGNNSQPLLAPAISISVSQPDLKEISESKKEDEDQKINLLESILKLSTSTLGNIKDDWPTAEERRNSIFLEKLISFDEKFLVLTFDTLLELPRERFIQMCFHGIFSHVIEIILLSPEKLSTIQRRKFLNCFDGEIVNLCCNVYGSHAVDKLWWFSSKLPIYKERIANEMVSESLKVKESNYGRLVWKNWKLELFTRKRVDWKAEVRESDNQFDKAVEELSKRNEKINEKMKNQNNNNDKQNKKQNEKQNENKQKELKKRPHETIENYVQRKSSKKPEKLRGRKLKKSRKAKT
ncbi:RNA-binding RNA processing protein NOP9 [Ascoidea rubescens DSM 1968]|uniref:Nucleolar protein 9 n=1 Tax=Ascoidea rubescens DSM 1968 TaxID=1344418 RepID=A0A1D2V8B5_9ASCO|nr:ARM repeat-containing protein [Ascoidea rubescens DSM 1968]ODV57889.1 ARM repeat-containing protein [Ascoidea rubescens DSM 1968]